MKRCALLVPAILNIVICVSTAHAQLLWDINGATAGATDDAGGLAAGIWDVGSGSPNDYNGNGTVDAADYVGWRKIPLLFGGVPDGYNAWFRDFGEPAGTPGTLNWTTDSTGASATIDWSPGQTAIFSAGSDATGNYAVTLSGTQSAGGVTFEEGTVTLTGGQLDLTGTGTITTATGTLQTISSVVGGSMLTKAGADRLLLTGANVYTGGTNINVGTLQFANPTAMPVSGAVAVATGATLSVNAGGGGEWSSATSGGGSIGGLIAGTGGQGTLNQITWANDSKLGIDTTNAAGAVSYSGVIGSFRAAAGTTNAVGLTKRGKGTLVLSGANTYTGATTMFDNSANSSALPSILKLAADNTLPSATVLAMPPNNGNAKVELYDAGGVPKNQTIAGLTGGGAGLTGPVVVDVGFAELTLNIPSGESNTYNGFLKTDFDQSDANHVGKVIKDGPGELIIGGSNNDPNYLFGGQLIVNAGRLGFGSSVAIGPSAGTGGSSRLKISNGATLFKANAAATGLTVNLRNVDINGSFTFDMTGAQGDAQLFIAATAPGGSLINLNSNATITVTSPVDPTFPATGTPLGFTPAFILAGQISDGASSFALTKAGPGLLTLNRINDYNGGTTISEGTLRLTVAATDATKPSTMGFTDGPGGQPDSPVTLAGGNLQYTGALINSVRKLTVDNPVTMTASSTISLRGGTGASGLSTTGVDFEFSDFTASAGTLTLLNNGNSNEPNQTTPTVNPVEFRVGFTDTSLTFAQPIVISNHPTIANRTTMLVSASTGDTTFSGDISGNGGVIRNGASGTTILSGNNTYTGNTVIDSGTLSIDNPYLADTADVLFVTTASGSPLLDLNFVGIDDIDQLFIDGAAQPTGIYDATHPSGLFDGTGQIRVNANFSSPGAVPEPGTVALAMMAMFVLSGVRRRHG
jgi:autotransporter-associated beta strand protein